MHSYVEIRKGEYYVTGTRVPVECVVAEFLRGASPETIHAAYPTLTLEQVYGAVAYFLGHEAELNEHFRRVDKEVSESARTPLRADLLARLGSTNQYRSGAASQL